MISAAGRKRKGDQAEREVLAVLREQLGGGLVRPRLEGDADKGDIAGLELCAVQIKSYADILRAIREGLEDAAHNKANANKLCGAAFIRRRGGNYLVAMTLDDWIALYREAIQ